mgnify:CR=1 FL=1
MKEAKKKKRDELKRMNASFNQLSKENYKKLNLNKCIKCKQETGNNFIFVYKKNSELKGKICLSCQAK